MTRFETQAEQAYRLKHSSEWPLAAAEDVVPMLWADENATSEPDDKPVYEPPAWACLAVVVLILLSVGGTALVLLVAGAPK